MARCAACGGRRLETVNTPRTPIVLGDPERRVVRVRVAGPLPVDESPPYGSVAYVSGSDVDRHVAAGLLHVT